MFLQADNSRIKNDINECTLKIINSVMANASLSESMLYNVVTKIFRKLMYIDRRG